MQLGWLMWSWFRSSSNIWQICTDLTDMNTSSLKDMYQLPTLTNWLTSPQGIRIWVSWMLNKYGSYGIIKEGEKSVYSKLYGNKTWITRKLLR